MTPQEQIRKLAEKYADEWNNNDTDFDLSVMFYNAILKGVELALAEPSEEMLDAGYDSACYGEGPAMSKDWSTAMTRILKAMSAVRLRELGVEE